MICVTPRDSSDFLWQLALDYLQGDLRFALTGVTASTGACQNDKNAGAFVFS